MIQHRRRFKRTRRAGLHWRVQVVVLSLLGLAALLAYAMGWWDSKLPSILTGRASVIDGDTIDIAGRRVRLQGIDAPEYDQTCTDAGKSTWSCGRSAARELGGLIKGRDLSCKPIDLDQYERVLAVCTLPDRSDVNAWMVRQGWAVTFGRRYATEEAEARAAERGLWAGAFVRPSEWRERSPN